LWACLSRAGHYHPYELSPTAPELRAWYHDVQALVVAFSTEAGAPPAAEAAGPTAPSA